MNNPITNPIGAKHGHPVAEDGAVFNPESAPSFTLTNDEARNAFSKMGVDPKWFTEEAQNRGLEISPLPDSESGPAE